MTAIEVMKIFTWPKYVRTDRVNKKSLQVQFFFICGAAQRIKVYTLFGRVSAGKVLIPEEIKVFCIATAESRAEYSSLDIGIQPFTFDTK